MGTGRSIINIKSLYVVFFPAKSSSSLYKYICLFSVLPEMVSKHADSFGFICQGYEISIRKISATSF